MNETAALVRELIAAAEAVARNVKMPVEGIDGGFVKVETPLATRLINAVSAVLTVRAATQGEETDG